jgi:putative peptidoglycan lipid II flippase
MVRRVIQFLSGEISGLHEAAYLLGLFAFLSQVLGLVRDRLLASGFGASRMLDIYYAGFRIPDFIFVSLASMVSISVLVPFLSERFERSPEEAKRFINNVFSVFFFAIMAVGVIVFALDPYLVPKVLPGFKDDPNLPLLVSVTRILLLSPIFLGFSNFLASITQIYNRFFLYAVSPLLYNLGIIFGITVLYPFFGLKGLAFGVVGGAFFHFFIQAPFVWKLGMFPKISWRINFNEIKRVIFLSLPRTLTLSSNQLATFVLIALASLMVGGSIAIFNYAFNLQSVPLSIVGVSYSSAAFPLLSRLLSGGRRDKFLEHMIIAAKHIIFWSMPIMTLFVVLRAQIVRVILGSGQFNWTDTRLTAACLALFALSLVPQSLLLIFVRAYYSGGKTWKPMVINLCSSALIVALGFWFVYLYNSFPFFRYFVESLLRVSDVPGALVLTLPLAYSIGVLINMLIHWLAFEKDFSGFSLAVLPGFYDVFGASVIGGFVTYKVLDFLGNLFNLNHFFGIFSQGFLAGIVGVAVIVVVLKLLKSAELSDVWRTFHRKIWKARVVPADPTENPNP